MWIKAYSNYSIYRNDLQKFSKWQFFEVIWYLHQFGVL